VIDAYTARILDERSATHEIPASLDAVSEARSRQLSASRR